MAFVKTILFWIWENIFDIALVLVGAAAFITYFLENRRKMKTAATLIVYQIDAIEDAVKALRTSKELSDAVLYKSKQIISENYWQKYKHILLRKLKPSQIYKMDKFYSQAEEIEKSRLFLCNEATVTVNNKDLVFQLKVAEEFIKTGKFVFDKSPLYDYYGSGVSFYSKNPRCYLEDILCTYEKMADTNDGIEAYKKLKKISYSKRL